MPVLPGAHAASLVRQDEGGRTLFFPADKRCFVIPNPETEQRIIRRLKRIRFIQSAAWVLFAAVLINVIVITDRAGVRIPRWLFVSVSIVAMMAIQSCPEWAQRRLARGLEPADERASEQSLFDKLPTWVIVLGVAVAVSLVLYFGRAWPLKAVTWLDDIPRALQESKVLLKVAILIAGGGAMLWGGIGALKKWVQSSNDHPS
jgi:hypothetical protein